MKSKLKNENEKKKLPFWFHYKLKNSKTLPLESRTGDQLRVGYVPSSYFNKTSDGKGWRIATIVASVVAVCGVGFGVYGMMQGTQESPDSAYKDFRPCRQ